MTEKLLKWNKSQAEYAYVTLTRYLPVHVSILPDSRLNPECISLLRSQAAISSGKGCVDVTLAYLGKKLQYMDSQKLHHSAANAQKIPTASGTSPTPFWLTHFFPQGVRKLRHNSHDIEQKRDDSCHYNFALTE